MTIVKANGIQLYCEISGVGDFALVLVHGSWDSHNDWDLVVPDLAQNFKVVTYDRRGHSQSERPSGQGCITEDVQDLASLIEELRIAPAWVVGNSFGASISLRLALDRPDLLRGLIVHEPPLLSLLTNDSSAEETLKDVKQNIAAVVGLIASGDHPGAAKHFVGLALGPGAWDEIPPEYQQIIIHNAPTFLDESKDPQQFAFDIEGFKRFTKPVLFTCGDQSPPMFAPIVAKLAAALPLCDVMTLPGAGHTPHVTHPTLYVERIIEFIGKNAART